jgi:hypothetical protein
MSIKRNSERLDVSSLQNHLSDALDAAETEPAKYHLREAYQKVIILDEGDS